MSKDQTANQAGQGSGINWSASAAGLAGGTAGALLFDQAFLIGVVAGAFVLLHHVVADLVVGLVDSVGI